MFSTNRVIRFFNQNRRKIFRSIFIIVGVIIVIQTLNALAGMQQRQVSNTEQNTNSERGKVYQPNKTILTNGTLNEDVAKENTEIINNFVNFCINGDIKNAYNLLTQDCKNIFYSDLDKFNNNYCKKIFNNKKEYNIQNWINSGNSYTYKIRYTNDILATGGKDIEAIEDYITIIKENNQNKLNINSFIRRIELDRQIEDKNIVYSIPYKDIHQNYEEYAITVKNNTENDILLDSLKDIEGIKLIGENNNVEYQALINELSLYDITVPSKNTKTINIKFSREYNPRRKLQGILFRNIILNKEEFLENNNDVKITSVNITL